MALRTNLGIILIQPRSIMASSIQSSLYHSTTNLPIQDEPRNLATHGQGSKEKRREVDHQEHHGVDP
ncbi:hypothetical protein LINPERPRIM_LOCUS17542 [Linum perenne]